MKTYTFLTKLGITDLIDLYPFSEWGEYVPHAAILFIDKGFEEEEYYHENANKYKSLVISNNETYIDVLHKTGRYGLEVENGGMTLEDNPNFDLNTVIKGDLPFTSHRMVFIDFENPEVIQQRNNPSIIPEGIREKPLTPDECYPTLGKGLQTFDVRLPGNFPYSSGIDPYKGEIGYTKDWTIRLDIKEGESVSSTLEKHFKQNPKSKELWNKGEVKFDIFNGNMLVTTATNNTAKNED